jgi:hypothetical protein
MPVDREKEVLFIHIPRTGGTKIEQSLNMTFGGDDVQVMKDKLFGYAPLEKEKVELQHLTYKQMIKSGLLTQKEFNQCFKFAFVRNPYDKLVSTYFFIGHKYFESFESFIRFLQVGGEPDKFPSRWSRLAGFEWFLEHPLCKPQHEFICDKDGKLMVDFQGRFENYTKDLISVLDELGITHSKKTLLQKVNTTTHDKYRTYYSQQTKKIVKSIYKKDFEIFDYR